MLAVANFHYIRENFSTKYPSIFGLTPKQFKSQLKELSKYGNFVSQQEVLKGISQHEKAILITFDDGLREQFELAKPILDEMGIPFICFVNTSNFTDRKVSLVHKIHLLRTVISPANLEKEIKNISSVELKDEEIEKAVAHYNYDDEDVARLKYLLNFRLRITEQKKIIEPLFLKYFEEEETVSELYMDENQLKVLWEEDRLGSHGHGHDPLGLLSREEVLNDLAKTQDYFETKFGKKALTFSYPYGSYEACKNLSLPLKKHGFKIAFTMERAVNKVVVKNSFMLARFDCNDLPGGKGNLLKENELFSNPYFAKWHDYEDGTAYQQ